MLCQVKKEKTQDDVVELDATMHSVFEGVRRMFEFFFFSTVVCGLSHGTGVSRLYTYLGSLLDSFSLSEIESR